MDLNSDRHCLQPEVNIFNSLAMSIDIRLVFFALQIIIAHLKRIVHILNGEV